MSTALDLIGTAETIALYDQYVIANYRKFPVALARGEGSWVWDAEENRYLDLFNGWGCNLLGHCPPRVVEAVRDQVGKLIHVPNTWHVEPQAQFAKALSERSFGGKCFFCNSGAEAIESAIKLARLHGAPRGKFKIVTVEGSFHGRTYAAMTATAQTKYHAGFEPLVPGFSYIPHNDLDAAKAAIDDQTAALIIEPIQGEGGIRLPAPGYLAGLKEICAAKGALLIFDEVQTGMGRTGEWFAHRLYDVEPDMITLAKALASGVAAGALIARDELARLLKPGTHACTFGGNPIACRAGLATIETIDDEGLLVRAKLVGERFRTRFESLRERRPGLIKDIRIVGVMIGVEIAGDAARAVEACLEERVLVNATNVNVVRLLPAMNITDDQIDQGCEVIAKALGRVAAEV